MSPLGGFQLEYYHTIWYRQIRMIRLPDGEKSVDDTFSRFDRIPACDGQTSCHGMVHAMHMHHTVKK